MDPKKLSRRARILVASGLLMAVVPTLLNDVVKMPDFVRGVLMGLGIGLETAGLILRRRLRKTEFGC